MCKVNAFSEFFFHHPKSHPILSPPTNLGYYWSIFWRFHHMHVKLFSHSSAKNCFDLLIIISSPLLMTVESNYFIRMGSTCKDFTIVSCSKTRKQYVFRIKPSRPLAFWKFQHFLDCLGFKAVLVPLVSISTKRNASQRKKALVTLDPYLQPYQFQHCIVIENMRGCKISRVHGFLINGTIQKLEIHRWSLLTWICARHFNYIDI